MVQSFAFRLEDSYTHDGTGSKRCTECWFIWAMLNLTLQLLSKVIDR
jgi:hypothetical protein